MRVLRVEAEGLATSFRYPHFLVGRQPTFRMPPPATIYGHICSAAGDLLDPRALRFGYAFYYDGVADDLELLHIATVAGGRNLPGAREIPSNIEAKPTPTSRELLLFPRLTLYIDAPGLLERLTHAFREPRYVVVLGRSQDLMSYRRVDVVELEEGRQAYLEATLLPWSYRSRTQAGIGVTMPRFIDPADRHRVIWSPYIVLEGRVWLAAPGEDLPPSPSIVARTSPDERVWVDPLSPDIRGLRRGIVWHDFLPSAHDGPHFLSPTTSHLG